MKEDGSSEVFCGQDEKKWDYYLGVENNRRELFVVQLLRNGEQQNKVTARILSSLCTAIF